MKMIKVGRGISYVIKGLEINNIKEFTNGFKFNIEKEDAKNFVNFSQFDFLGISNRHKITKQYLKDVDTKVGVDTINKSLNKIFKQPILIIKDEQNIHNFILSAAISSKDIIVIDQFVSTNIRIAGDLLKIKGVEVEYIKHNQLKELEDIILRNRNKYNRVWYIAQSIYPVPGDRMPNEHVLQFLERYDHFFLYVNDSDSLGWIGENGMGFICQDFPELKKVVLVASLTKGFGAETGAIISTDEDIKEITSCFPLGSLIKSDAINQNILKCCEIHLSNEITELQFQLQERIRLFNNLAEYQSLPIIKETLLPEKFIAAGTPGICQEICTHLLKAGIYVGSVFFPEVPIDYSGIKVNLTINHSMSDIKYLVSTMNEAFYFALKKRKISSKDFKVFQH